MFRDFLIFNSLCDFLELISSSKVNILFQDYRNRMCLIMERFHFLRLVGYPFLSIIKNFQKNLWFFYLEYISLNNKNRINFSTFLLPFRITRKISLSPILDEDSLDLYRRKSILFVISKPQRHNARSLSNFIAFILEHYLI